MQSWCIVNFRLCELKNRLSQDLNSHDKLHCSRKVRKQRNATSTKQNLPKTCRIMIFCLAQRLGVLVIVLKCNYRLWCDHFQIHQSGWFDTTIFSNNAAPCCLAFCLLYQYLLHFPLNVCTHENFTKSTIKQIFIIFICASEWVSERLFCCLKASEIEFVSNLMINILHCTEWSEWEVNKSYTHWHLNYHFNALVSIQI